MPSSEEIPPSAIDAAPDLPAEADSPDSLTDEIWTLFNELQVENQKLTAENERLSAKVDIDQEKAKLLQPYANKVFWFLVGYCVFVAAMVVLAGFTYKGFNIHVAVLGVLVGSTAVSAIGLVGIVVTGLFARK